MNLGENIYKQRTAKNLSQEDLANALEVSRQSVSKWENNSAVPELDKLVKMAQLFGISLDELVTGKETAPQPIPAADRKAALSVKMILGFLLVTLALLLLCLSLVIPDVELEGALYFALILGTGGVACLWPLRHFSNHLVFTLDGLFLLMSLHAPQSTLILAGPFAAIFLVQLWQASKEKVNPDS